VKELKSVIDDKEKIIEKIKNDRESDLQNQLDELDKLR